MSSAAEAEIGAGFIAAQESIPMRQCLEELGYKQLLLLIKIDNTTAVGFMTDSIKPKKTRAIDMRYHWVLDREAQHQFKFE